MYSRFLYPPAHDRASYGGRLFGRLPPAGVGSMMGEEEDGFDGRDSLVVPMVLILVNLTTRGGELNA